MRSLLLMSVLLCSMVVDAQVVNRCRDANGVTLFTDRPCHSHGATPIAAPEALPGTELARGITLHRRPHGDIPEAALGCPARDPPQLLERIQEALLHRDLNALAGLVAWGGAGRHQAERVLGDLQSLIDGNARGLRLHHDAWAASDQALLPRLHIHRDLQALDPPQSYQLVRGAGCVWLAG
jgi:hypothetical protein